MKYVFLFAFLTASVCLKAQDCVGYWNYCHNDTVNNYHDSYKLVVDGKGRGVSVSGFVLDTETIETEFTLSPGRDYRMSVCSSSKNKPIIKLYEFGTQNVIYSNVENDTISVFEFEQRFVVKVKAVVSLPAQKRKSTAGMLKLKSQRYCLGFKLESMITRK